MADVKINPLWQDAFTGEYRDVRRVAIHLDAETATRALFLLDSVGIKPLKVKDVTKELDLLRSAAKDLLSLVPDDDQP